MFKVCDDKCSLDTAEQCRACRCEHVIAIAINEARYMSSVGVENTLEEEDATLVVLVVKT